MTDAKSTEQVARNTILKLLSDEENARVSTGEAASRLTEGAEYLDLQHLDRGVQRAGITMGNVLPRSAVSDETWSKILAHLDGATLVKPRQFQARVQGAACRLFQDPGFKIHFLVYAAVNALLVVINLATTPGKYWFFWPLLGWGIGVAGHAFGVLRRSRRS
jgi:hypothetical protein